MGKQEIGEKELRLREMTEKRFASSTTKRSVGTKEVLAEALRQQVAAVPAKKPKSEKKKRG